MSALVTDAPLLTDGAKACPINRGDVIRYMCIHFLCTSEEASCALRSVRSWLTDNRLDARFYILAVPGSTCAFTDRPGLKLAVSNYDAEPINRLSPHHHHKQALHRYLRALLDQVI